MKGNAHLQHMILFKTAALAFGDFFFLKPAFSKKLLLLLPLLLCFRTLLNAQCTGSQTIHANNVSNTQFGQYIQANCTGVLTNFTYETLDFAGASATVTVRSGIGCSGPILGTQTIAQVIGVNSVNFSPAIAVTNGQNYSIIIVTSSDTRIKTNQSGTYSTGGLLWTPACTVFGASGDWDMVFSYTISPPVPCTTPTAYSVSGSGIICPSASADISLSGSQSGHTYQLQRNGTNTGSPVNGTGNALTFQATQTGTYTVVATSPAGGTCTALMSGSAVLTNDNAPPTIACADPVTVNTTAGQCTGTTTLAAPTTSDNCPTGNALHFDGINDVVRVADNNLLDLNFPLTLEAWFYQTGVSFANIIVDKRTANDNNLGYGIWLNNAKPAFYLDNNGNASGGHVIHVSPNTLSTNAWHHMAAVYDGARVKIYVDGVLTYDQPETNPITPTSEQLSIGDRNQGGQGFAGRLEEVRIWNVARTLSQIQTNMNVELNAQSGLVAVYHFNEGVAGNSNAAVTTAPDASGNNLNGTLNNFLLSGPTSNWTTGYLNSTPRLTNNAPATYQKGSTVVTWTATDFSGNSATCQQTVTVTDNQAPTLTNPGNQAMNVIANTCAANYTIADPVSDNCTGSTWGYTLTGATTATVTGIPDGTSSGVLSFNNGVTTVVLSATDGTNSAATVSFTVTVQDGTDTDGDGTADCNDGCPNDPNKIAPGNCGCGNSDTGPLTVTCPASVPVISTNSNCQGTIQDYTALAMVSGTGCATSTVVQTPPQGTIVNPGTVVIKLTVTDSNSGETANCVFNVTVSGGCGN